MHRKNPSLRLHSRVSTRSKFRHVILSKGNQLITENGELIEVWDREMKQQVSRYSHKYNVTAMTLLKNGNVAIVDDKLRIELITINFAGAFSSHFSTQEFYVYAITTLRDGSLVLGHAYGVISIWDITLKKKIKQIETGMSDIKAMNTLSNGHLVVADEHTIAIFDTETAQKVYQFSVYVVQDFIILPDDSIAVGFSNGDLCHYDISAKEPILKFADMPKNINGSDLKLIYMPDGRIGRFTPNTIDYFKPSAAFSLRIHPHWEQIVEEFNCLILLNDGIHFLVSIIDTIQVWNIQTRECVWEEKARCHITAFALLNDNRLVMMDADNKVNLVELDIQTRRLNYTASFPTHIKPVYCVTVLENGWLATGHKKGAIRLWNVATYEEEQTFDLPDGDVTSMNTRADGSLVIGNQWGSVFIYDWKNKHFIDEMTDNTSDHAICGLAALPDDTILFGDRSGIIKLWNPETNIVIDQIFMDIPIQEFIAMPNGTIGCFTNDSLYFIEPSWRHDYMNTEKILRAHLPDKKITEIVSAYMIKLTLFNPPKFPHHVECILEEGQMPALKPTSF